MSNLRELERLEVEAGALLTRHNARRSLKSFARYKGRPLDFMRDELGFTPYDKQVEIVDAFLAHRWTAVRGFHGAGKDAVLGALMLHAAYCEGMLVLAISATERQLTGQLWKELRERFTFNNRLPGEL